MGLKKIICLVVIAIEMLNKVQTQYIPWDRSSIMNDNAGNSDYYFQLPHGQQMQQRSISYGAHQLNNFDDKVITLQLGEEFTNSNNKKFNNRYRRQDAINDDDTGNGRLLSQSAFSKISETLGALNTVGRYIVNMTRGQDHHHQNFNINNNNNNNEITMESEDNVPDAILTLTKTVLGQNVTKTIEPLIKRVGLLDNDKENLIKKKINKSDQLESSPSTKVVDVQSKDGENRCRTPDGKQGRCEDLSNCPGLLLDLGHLRESLCFKSLFVPGVCCPIQDQIITTTQRPIKLTARPTQKPIPSQSLVLKPLTTLAPAFKPTITTVASTTTRPMVPVYTIPTTPSIDGNNLSGEDLLANIVNPEDCGQQEYTSGRIVGGIESANGQWPWMAAIFLHGPKRTEFWCGGSLIGTKYILTAAHCTRDSRQRPFAARQFTVRLGDIDLSTDKEQSAPVTFKVKEVRAHQRFSRVGFYNDIAILVLDQPVRKSKYVIPVCLPKEQASIPKERLIGRRATVVGWGTTYYGGKESTVQRQADLPIWRNEDCNRAYFQPITDNFLCAGYSEGGVDACQGDSGGPLMMLVDTRWTQLGVVSFGNKCGEPGYPGVYTRLTEYVEWIKENTKN